MRLRNLELSNFRGFPAANATIDLDHDAVLLYGRNGVGKTAIFDAFELALTGSLRRVASVPDIASVLVNARHDSEPATLRLEIGDQTGHSETKSTIRLGQTLSVKPLLGLSEIPTFLHTAYLQQSDIRRLISADSATLGEVVRSLAVSGEIERLDRALAEANLTRLNPVYRGVAKAFEDKQATAEQLKRQIEADERAISDIEGVEATLSRAAETVHNVETSLDVTPSGAHANAEEILKAITALDGILQSRLTEAISRRSQSESRLKRAEQLLQQQRALEIEQAQAVGSGRADQSRREVSAVEQEIQGYLTEMAQPAFAATSKQQQSRMIALLEAARAFSAAGACPICDRPFPDLVSHIDAKVAQLQREQSRLQSEYFQLQRRLTAAEEKSQQLKSAVEKSERASKDLAARVLNHERQWHELSSAYPERPKSISEIAYMEKSLFETAVEDTAVMSSFATQLSVARSEISSASIRSAQIKKNLANSRDKLRSILSDLDSAKKSRQMLEEYVNTAQDVRKRTSEGIEKILQSFAMGPTRENFEDLFSRLAREPHFKVTISQARVLRRKPEVHWCATYGTKQYPGEAIFSQGELNCCAMAFFLALATTNPQSLGFLLLDDPVQNMDEMHIEEFGSILKFIKDQLGWQLIVALHDESIYQYLKRQLYPCQGRQSLAAYTLEMGDSGTEINQDVVAHFDRHAFLPSEVA
ncbi:MAG TPA: AAA family ATPase [Candidatus Angelobacter sp.]